MVWNTATVVERSGFAVGFVTLVVMTSSKSIPLTLFLLVLIAVLVCGEGELERPDPPSTVVATESLDVGSASTALIPTHSVYEEAAVGIMWEMFQRYGAVNESAVIAAGRNAHPGLIPVLVEASARTYEPDLALEISRALEKITGENVGGDFVLAGPWFSWMSRQDSPQVMLPEFDEWKGQLLGTIDPAFSEFIYGGVATRIPLWTVEWGVVVKDGVPPLEFANTVPGDEVDFLNPDEPVFGVTVNGESRAYPHRIMGWHELANDRLGAS